MLVALLCADYKEKYALINRFNNTREVALKVQRLFDTQDSAPNIEARYLKGSKYYRTL